MAQRGSGDRPHTETLRVDGAGEGFGDTTARQEKPSFLVDVPSASTGETFGDTTAKQAVVLPDATSKDEAITIKDNHKKTMQSAIAVDLVGAPETTVPSTLDDEPEAAQPKRPRVGPPTLASPGVPQAEWDGAPAYPNIAGYGGSPSPGPSPNAAPMGYAPPLGSPPPGMPPAAGSGNYAQAQPRAPLPPTYRISKKGPSGMQIALVLLGIGVAFVIFAIGILLFVSKRIASPPTASTRSTPPTEIAPGSSAAASPSATAFATTTSTTPPLQVESPQPATPAPQPTTAPSPIPTPRATGGSKKTPPGRGKNGLQEGR